jgi:serine/threonine protein phosphatase PrpC
MRIGAATDIGQKRKLNEDSFFIYDQDSILCGFVADGMGGHQAGEVASSMASELIKAYVSAHFSPEMDYVEAGEMLRRSFIESNSEIYHYAISHSKLMGMGCTATLAMLYQDKLIAAHVGDSRIYKITKDSIEQITRDHSYVQELLMRGEITQEFARWHPQKNYITRAMGTEETIKVDIAIGSYKGEVILLTSDGLTNMVEDEEIQKVILKHQDLQQAVDALVALANENGGSDNITAVAFER